MFRMFKSGVDDLVLISSPSNGEITSQLGARFDRELIYTAIGDVLISVNPYKQLPITGEEHIKMYQYSKATDAPPHIYKLAEGVSVCYCFHSLPVPGLLKVGG